MVSVSDPDTQRMKANVGDVQGYNAPAVVDAGQIVIAAEITNTPGDFSNLDPMVTAALNVFERAGVIARPETGFYLNPPGGYGNRATSSRRSARRLRTGRRSGAIVRPRSGSAGPLRGTDVPLSVRLSRERAQFAPLLVSQPVGRPARNHASGTARPQEP
jgi:hypothetical protein